MADRLALAVADALAEMGWDGARSVLCVDVRRGEVPLGRVELHVLPYDAVEHQGERYLVTREAFLAALRGDPPAPARMAVIGEVTKRATVAAWAAGTPSPYATSAD